MIGENRQLVTNEPVEVQDCMKIIDYFRGIYRIYPNLRKENRRMSTCNWLDLQTLGSQPIIPKNLPDHCPTPTPLSTSAYVFKTTPCVFVAFHCSSSFSSYSLNPLNTEVQSSKLYW
jgi:hypothetical protein